MASRYRLPSTSTRSWPSAWSTINGELSAKVDICVNPCHTTAASRAIQASDRPVRFHGCPRYVPVPRTIDSVRSRPGRAEPLHRVRSSRWGAGLRLDCPLSLNRDRRPFRSGDGADGRVAGRVLTDRGLNVAEIEIGMGKSGSPGLLARRGRHRAEPPHPGRGRRRPVLADRRLPVRRARHRRRSGRRHQSRLCGRTEPPRRGRRPAPRRPLVPLRRPGEVPGRDPRPVARPRGSSGCGRSTRRPSTPS